MEALCLFVWQYSAKDLRAFDATALRRGGSRLQLPQPTTSAFDARGIEGAGCKPVGSCDREAPRGKPVASRRWLWACW